MELLYTKSARVQSGTKYLTDYSQKDKPWDTHRSNSQQVAEMYAAGPDEFSGLVKRMLLCSGVLGFTRAIDESSGEIRYRLKTARFCRVRHCPVCGWRRTLRNKGRFLKTLPKLLESFPTHRFLFLTLTVPNCDICGLRETLQGMNKAWGRLVKRKEFGLVTGWVRSTEVTYSKSHAGNAHPHFHCMLMVKPSYFSHGYVKQEDWLDAWRGAMRDDTITQVNIKAMRGEKAIAEVLKYAVKESDLIESPEWLFELTRQVKQLRFLATGGLLKEMLKEDMSEKEMIVGGEPDDNGDKAEDEVSLVATWLPGARRYAAKHV